MTWDSTEGMLNRGSDAPVGICHSGSLFAALAAAVSLLDLACNSLLAYQAVPVYFYSLFPCLIALVQLFTGLTLVLKGRALRKTLRALVPHGDDSDSTEQKLRGFLHRLAMAGQLSGLFATLNTLLLLAAYKLKTTSPATSIAVTFLGVLLRVGNMCAQVFYCSKPPDNPPPKTVSSGSALSKLTHKIAPAPTSKERATP
jgi:hypothetical protein